MKRDAIVQDFKELLTSIDNKAEDFSRLRRFWNLMAQTTAHLLVLFLLSGVGIGIWMILLSRNSGKIDNTWCSIFYLPFAVNIILTVMQSIFSWIS